MKKNSLALIALLLTFHFTSNAQTWSGATPGDIYYNSGKVGIGTSSPGTMLDVQGSTSGNIVTNVKNTGMGRAMVTIDAGGTSTSILGFLNQGTAKYTILSTSNGGLGFYDEPASFYSMFITPTAGNIGIGTTTPTAVQSSSNRVLNMLGTSNGAEVVLERSGGSSKGYWSQTPGDNTKIGTSASYPLIFETNLSERLRIAGDGKVGIGTTSPTLANLVVYGNQGIAIDGNNAASQLNFYNSGTVLGSIGKGNYAVTSADQTGVSMYSVGAMSFASGGQSERMRIASNGKVGIGTDNPDELLSVKGTIHSQEVKVDLAGWSDYVFKPTYKLPSLSSIKTYIDKNQHLPEVPSEEEMMKNGLKVGEMNKLMMKKVEELTLYLIEKDKQMEEQRIINRSLQAQLNQIKKQIAIKAAKH